MTMSNSLLIYNHFLMVFLAELYYSLNKLFKPVSVENVGVK